MLPILLQFLALFCLCQNMQLTLSDSNKNFILTFTKHPVTIIIDLISFLMSS